MNKIEYSPIGTIHSPFKTPAGTPIQTSASEGTEGRIELLPELSPGLKDLEGFSHIILLYHFHMAKPPQLLSTPFMDSEPHGIFAIRGPSRPNSIGLSVVRLQEIRENVITVLDIDILDGTPLLDIKPYIPKFDVKNVTSIGWLDKNISKLKETQDDGRFAE
jgi:tRNA-Thr(GGU) m(6)t(6)A37 methyltransferase TsaA